MRHYARKTEAPFRKANTGIEGPDIRQRNYLHPKVPRKRTYGNLPFVTVDTD